MAQGDTEKARKYAMRSSKLSPEIIESSKNNSLANMITEVNIADSTNYILTIASESKTVQFGDISNVNVKLLKIEALIELEKGIPGQIYFQDSEKTVFSEEVKR